MQAWNLSHMEAEAGAHTYTHTHTEWGSAGVVSGRDWSLRLLGNQTKVQGPFLWSTLAHISLGLGLCHPPASSSSVPGMCLCLMSWASEPTFL